jgi:tetratricopeptide (TPR) repeat protein
MWKPTVCAAMTKAYEEAQGDLALRLLIALEAAEREGGDIRGKQSAALLVVSDDANAPGWGGRVVDLRVEDHAEPLVELRRLLTVAQAYRLMNEGDEHLANGDVGKASAAYRGASKLVPDNHETVFWHAVTLASAGREEEALPLFAEAFERWPRWRELVRRLPESGLLPDDQDLMRRIVAVR